MSLIPSSLSLSSRRKEGGKERGASSRAPSFVESRADWIVLFSRRESELAKVLEMSEKEERDRKKEEDERIRKLDEQNSRALFDDSLQM